MMFRPGNIGHLGRLGLIAGSQPSLVTKALAILAKYGSAANLYLPGVGAISGITAGNWLDSSGTTAATVDNPVGLVLSAGKAVGPELVANGSFDGGLSGWTQLIGNSSVVSGAARVVTPSGSTTTPGRLGTSSPISCVVGRTYRCTARCVTGTAAGADIHIAVLPTSVAGAIASRFTTGTTDAQFFFTATQTQHWIFLEARAGSGGTYSDFDNVSVVEVPSAQLTQSTAANRPILRLSGGVHSWQFDGTNDHFVTTLATPDTGYYVGGALCTNTGATHTIGGGSGAWADDSAGVWVARQSNGNIRVSVGNGTTRNNLLSQASPINSAFVASAGWNLSNLFTGVNNTEVAISNSINCSTSRPIYVGTTVGTAPTSLISPMIGNLYAQIWILGFTPTVAERATLRQFVASLSGVTL